MKNNNRQLMKPIIVLTLILTAATAGAQIPVTDLANLAQALQQVTVASQQLTQLETELKRMGDPAAIGAKMVPALIQSLGRLGVGQTGLELRTSATGTAGVAYDGDGLYIPPTEVILTSDGQQFQRQLEPYKKFDAVTRGRAALEQVMQDTEERRQQLRRQIQSSISQLQSAKTMAEVQKVQGTITAESAELAAIDREREAAINSIQVQGIENQTDAARQELARLEERLVEFRSASDKVGHLLTPDPTPIVIPDPRNRLP